MGLGRNLARLSAGSLLLVRQRLELASIEVEEELLRTALLFARTLVAALLLALARVFAAATVIIVFWDSARVAAALGVTACFAVGGGWVAWRLASALRARPPFLAATLAELHKDAERLGAQP